MPTPQEIQALEDALTAARESLAAEQSAEQGGKSADAPETPSGTTFTRDDIRRSIADEVRAQAEAAAQAQTGAGSKVDVAALVRETVKEVLAAQPQAETGTDIKAIVAEEIARFRSPRKTPLASPDDDGATNGQGGKGGTFIPKHKMGEPDNFNSFILALGRKDGRAIGDMQRAHGITSGYGGKALVEGTGALDGTAGPSGGYLVPPEFAQELIPLLYPYVMVRRAGPVIRTLNSPQFYQPRLTGGATATYVGETAAIPVSQQTFDQFSLLAKTLTAMVPISRFLVQDSDPGIADIVKTDAARQIGLKEDYTFLLGVGSATVPQGILTASGVSTINPTDGTNGDVPAYGDFVDMKTTLAASDVPEVKRAWFCHPRMLGRLQKVLDDDKRPIFYSLNDVQNGTLTQSQPTLLGYPLYTSTRMPIDTISGKKTTNIALVEMSEVVLGQLGTMEMAWSDEASYVDGSSNTISSFQQNLSVVRIIERHDIGLSHAAAVVYRKSFIYT